MDPVAHASIGLIARPFAPKAPLLALVAATAVPDLLFFAFEAAGIEHQAVTRMDFSQGLTYLSPARIPWSHGLLTCAVWSVAAAAIAWLVWQDRRTSLVMGLMVFSHWVLDFVAYNNLPLALNGSPEVGIGLITTGPGVIIGILLEVGLIGGGLFAYLRTRRKGAETRRVGREEP